MSFVKGLVDRIIFTFGVLLFMQAPHFIDQYEQRLGGFYQAQINHLQRYQEIADQQHGGNLTDLINDFESSNQSSVQQTGKHIRELNAQAKQLESDVAALTENSFVHKLSYLLTSMKLEIAQAVIKSFRPALPISLEAVICGFIGGLILSCLFNLCFGFSNGTSKTNKKHKQKSNNKTKSNIQHRVEPTIMRPTRAA